MLQTFTGITADLKQPMGPQRTNIDLQVNQYAISPLLRISIVGKKHHDQVNSYKGKHFIWADLRFRGLVHYHQDRKHDSIQADMELEELRVPHLDQKAARR